MPIGSAGDGGASRIETQRQNRINAGLQNIDKAFSGFNNDWFNQRRQDYLNYATPQAIRQFQNTRNNLAYSLARNGLSKSGAAVNENQALETEKNQRLSDIANEGQNQANEARSQVAAQKANVTNQLVSSADPSLARESAASATAGLSAPPAYQPIGQLFSDFSQQYLANQSAKAYSNSGGDYTLTNLFSR